MEASREAGRSILDSCDWILPEQDRFTAADLARPPLVDWAKAALDLEARRRKGTKPAGR